MDGSEIIRWRAAHRLKQSAFAEMVGVSQATISKWESNVWLPSKTMALRLNEVMSGIHEGRIAIELACLQPQQQMKSIVRGSNIQVMGFSDGFRKLWPETCDFLGTSIRDLLSNEAAEYCDGGDLLREAIDGEILMTTCVSNRIMSIGEEVDVRQRTRWHAIVRRIDGELIHELIYEPCDPNTPTGFEKILRRADLAMNLE